MPQSQTTDFNNPVNTTSLGAQNQYSFINNQFPGGSIPVIAPLALNQTNPAYVAAASQLQGMYIYPTPTGYLQTAPNLMLGSAPGMLQGTVDVGNVGHVGSIQNHKISGFDPTQHFGTIPQLPNRKVKHSVMSKTNLYINGLCEFDTDDTVRGLVKDIIEPKSCKAMMSHGKCRGSGFIDCATEEDAEKVIHELRNKTMRDGSKLTVKFAYENEKDDLNVYVRNLPRKSSFTNSNLEDLFREFGQVVSVKLLQSDNQYTGTGFVRFNQPEEAQKAVETMNSRKLILGDDEKPVICKLADKGGRRANSSNSGGPLNSNHSSASNNISHQNGSMSLDSSHIHHHHHNQNGGSMSNAGGGSHTNNTVNSSSHSQPNGTTIFDNAAIMNGLQAAVAAAGQHHHLSGPHHHHHHNGPPHPHQHPIVDPQPPQHHPHHPQVQMAPHAHLYHPHHPHQQHPHHHQPQNTTNPGFPTPQQQHQAVVSSGAPQHQIGVVPTSTIAWQPGFNPTPTAHLVTDPSVATTTNMLAHEFQSLMLATSQQASQQQQNPDDLAHQLAAQLFNANNSTAAHNTNINNGGNYNNGAGSNSNNQVTRVIAALAHIQQNSTNPNNNNSSSTNSRQQPQTYGGAVTNSAASGAPNSRNSVAMPAPQMGHQFYQPQQQQAPPQQSSQTNIATPCTTTTISTTPTTNTTPAATTNTPNAATVTD